MSNTIDIMNVNITEDFPDLPIQKNKTKKDHKERSYSAGSSMSSASVGAFRDQKTTRVELLPKGTYINVEDLIVRPQLRCHCERCGTDWLTESEWAKSKCQRSKKIAADSGFHYEVIDSKIIHHRVGLKHSKFSVARIQWETKIEVVDNEGVQTTETRTRRGWCFSKCLQKTHQQQIRSVSIARSSVDSRREVDRSRSNSVASSFQPTYGFMLGEPVLARADGVNWVKAFVRHVNPLQVVVEGTGQVVSHISQVKKMKTRKFVLAKDMSVRSTQIDDRWAVKLGDLKKGTTIDVSACGYEGYVAYPVCGWITMRSAHSLNVVTETFIPDEQEPTIFITNLPGDLTEAELRQKLIFQLHIVPKAIRFESNGRSVRAVLTLVSHAQALGLAQRKTFQIRYGWNLAFSWDLQYLQNKALSS